MKILITSGSWNAALVVMRSLARKGHRAFLADWDKYCAGFHSKYCSGGIILPRESHKEAFVEAVIGVLKREKFDLLVPMSDLTTEHLSDQRDRLLPYTHMCLPSRELIALARFKDRAYRFMLEHDIPIPQTYFPASYDDVGRLAQTIGYPCVVKKPRGSANRGNVYFDKKDGMTEYYRGLNEEDLWPVIQEFVDGAFYGCTAVAREGEILDCFMYTASQEYSLNGTPPYGESVINEDLFRTAQKIIKALKWHGVINLDFLKGKDGVFRFLEINPRFPGSTDFIMSCGLDFPALFMDLAFGKADGKFKGFSYKAGRKFRFVLPIEAIYSLRNKQHIPRMLLNFLDPSIATDLPWDDPKLLFWKLKHLAWYWRDKKHLRPASDGMQEDPFEEPRVEESPA